MQNLFKTSLTPQQYVEQDYQKQVKPPESCLNCGRAPSLEALAYYQRYVTSFTAVLLIWVRRFLCRHCRVSVSSLPEFAQPYRALNNATLEAGFNGQTQKREVQHWGAAIEVYWERFQAHLPRLLRQVGNAFGALPLQPTATDFWKQLLQHCGDLAGATAQLVHQFHTCWFGTYIRFRSFGPGAASSPAPPQWRAGITCRATRGSRLFTVKRAKTKARALLGHRHRPVAPALRRTGPARPGRSRRAKLPGHYRRSPAARLGTAALGCPDRALNWPPPGSVPASLQQLHQTYCALTCSPAEQECGRQRALEQLRQLKEQLR